MGTKVFYNGRCLQNEFAYPVVISFIKDEEGNLELEHYLHSGSSDNAPMENFFHDFVSRHGLDDTLFMIGLDTEELGTGKHYAQVHYDTASRFWEFDEITSWG